MSATCGVAHERKTEKAEKYTLVLYRGTLEPACYCHASEEKTVELSLTALQQIEVEQVMDDMQEYAEFFANIKLIDAAADVERRRAIAEEEGT